MRANRTARLLPALLLGEEYITRILSIAPASLVGLWALDDNLGNVARDHSKNGFDGVAANVTFKQPGPGAGITAGGFNGTSSFINLSHASLPAAINGDEGTLLSWVIVNAAGVWTDGAFRTIFMSQVDVNNLFILRKPNVSNQFNYIQTAGGTSVGVTLSSFSPTAYFNPAMTWSAAADEFKAYLDGDQTGSTQTGLGSFSGSPTNNKIGSQNATPTLIWSGDICLTALWSAPLTPAQIKSLSIV